MSQSIRRMRPLLIGLGLVAIAAEIGLNGYGVWVGESDLWLRAVILSVAAALPVGEAAMMLRAGQIAAGTRRGDVKWAYGLWAVCLVGGLFMTLNGASVREDRKEQTRVAGFLKTSTNEKTEAEAKADRDTLAANIKQIESAPNTNVSTPRNGPRSVDELGTDGRFNATKQCTDDASKRNLGQRNVCAEYHLRRGLDKMHADLKAIDEKLDKVRANFISGEVVVTSKEMPMYRRLRDMGLDPTFLQAVFMTLVLHGFASFVWHTVPARDGEDHHGGEPVDAHGVNRWQPVQVHVHAAQAPSQPSASPLALTAPGRVYDPAKQAMLIGKFWADVLPTLSKTRQSLSDPTWIARFNNLCAENNVETPSADEFAVLSRAHLPNITPLGGQWWFTPVG